MTDIDRAPNIRTDLPHAVEKNTTISIPMTDGVRLAATAWIPRQDEPRRGETSLFRTTINHFCCSLERFVTILEYLPYRKADWTSVESIDQTNELFSVYFLVQVRTETKFD